MENKKQICKDEINKYIEENLKKCIRFNQCDSGDLIGMPYPYTVPSTESFNELYYWDTYFTNVGLIKYGRADLAKNNVDNMLYIVDKYGFMPNGSRTYYLNRSQPPFLSEMVKDVYSYYRDKVWLRGAYSCLTKEYDFWMTKRAFSFGLNHYDAEFDKDEFEKAAGMFFRRTGIEGRCAADMGRHALATAESGWDMNPRWGTEAYNYAPADLNSLLYGFEKNMAGFSDILGNGEADVWEKRAEKRLKLMNEYMLNKENILTDYNVETQKHSDVFSAASYFGMFSNAATEEQAKVLVDNLERLEEACGISTCEKRESDIKYQWDYPNGWACLQYIMIVALDNYGYKKEAARIAEKYVLLTEKVFEETGNFWEKYNVAEGSINVSNEYKMPTMLGWSMGVYIYAKDFLNNMK